MSDDFVPTLTADELLPELDSAIGRVQRELLSTQLVVVKYKAEVERLNRLLEAQSSSTKSE